MTYITLVGWLVVLRIYVALAVFQPYCNLEAGDNQSLKGPITIRRTAIPRMVVNFSTFAFLLNFSFMKQIKH